ncbi:MAG TPA: hypothetical protein VKT82_20920 [Ktedonobacterales bacterium]|nr:hypothetical protein [Ktedonobacterales bacterium]
MNNDELVQTHGVRLFSIETRLSRIETLLDQLLSTLSSSNSEYDRHMHVQAILQELRSSHDPQMGSAAGFATTGYPQQMGGAPGAYPQQERPEIAAIRAAVRAGDKTQAIKLYRSLYGAGLQEAKAAVDAM